MTRFMFLPGWRTSSFDASNSVNAKGSDPTEKICNHAWLSGYVQSSGIDMARLRRATRTDGEALLVVAMFLSTVVIIVRRANR